MKFERSKESEFKKGDKTVEVFESDNVADFLKNLADIYVSEKLHEREQSFTY